MRLTITGAVLLQAVGLLVVLDTRAFAAPIFYKAIPLPTLGGRFVTPLAINASEQIAGYSETSGGDIHGFLYSDGGITDLGTFGGNESQGQGINISGQITGYSTFKDSPYVHAFVYTDGHMIDIGTLGGLGSNGYGINDMGQVTGWADHGNANSIANVAFLYAGGHMADLGSLGGTSSVGLGINNSGQVAGYLTLADGTAHAFLYTNGRMMDLGTLGGADSQGWAINDDGQVTGFSYTASFDTHAFLYSKGHMSDLGTLGGASSYGYEINSNGQVVGISSTAQKFTQDAFLFTDGSMYDLNKLLVGGLSSGEYLDNAWAINDGGWITAGSQIGHSYLLEPTSAVPEPASLSLISLGMLLTLGFRYKCRWLPVERS